MAATSDAPSDPFDIPLESEEPVGAVLAQMRRQQKMTGSELARIVGISQPTMSRLERGKTLPDPEVVAAIARALGAADDKIRALSERAERAHDQMTDWRPASFGLDDRQRSVADWESATAEIYDFQPAVLAGLLQTSTYARAALLSFQHLVQPDSDEAATLAAVTARIQRQEVLADEKKTFRFIITESVLQNRMCPAAEMIGQISHLRELLLRHANVVLGIIPEGTTMPIPPLHGFTLFGDSLVVIDVYNTGLISRGRSDVRQYRQVFDLFDAVTAPDVNAILDAHEARYVEQLTRRD